MCDKAAMDYTWGAEIRRHFPHLSYIVAHRDYDGRENRNGDIIIINHDGIKFTSFDPDSFILAIFDETTAFSHYKSQRTKAAIKLARSIKGFIGLTGNPIPSDTLQAYSQSCLIAEPKMRYTKYRLHTKIQFDMYTWRDKPNAKKEAFKILQPAIRHTRDDCIDLPPRTYVPIPAAMTPEQAKYYRQMERDLVVELAHTKTQIAAKTAMTKILKLMQISAGFLYTEDETYTLKYDWETLDRILSSDEQFIVLASFTAQILRLKKRYPDAVVAYGDDRSGIEVFKDRRILIAQPRVICRSLNFQFCRNIVWLNPPLSNELFDQTNGRIYRMGQKRKTFIHLVYRSEVEQRLYRALQRKHKVAQEFLSYYVCKRP